PKSGFYAKLNAIKFVPETELTREQAYWLNSQDHTPSKPVTPFVRKGPPPSQVLASLHLVKNDGFKVTNATQKTEISKLKAKDVGNKSSATTTPTNPKVLALGMYAIGPKYIIPHRRTNRETPIPMSRKKHVTFKEPPKPSPRVIKKPVAPQVKKANIAVHLST
nr:hypothetical protein [Tanacetum cinerariifolium]